MIFPKVVALVPVFNNGALMVEAVNSLMDHPADMHIVLCNDRSTDDIHKFFQEVIQRYPGKIRVLNNDVNMGTSKTRNKMIDFVQSGHPFMSGIGTSDYLMFLDHDDLSHPGRIEAQIRYLDLHPECKLVGGQFVMFGNGIDETVSEMPCGYEECKIFSLFEAINLPSTYMCRIGDTYHPEFRFETYYAEDWDFMLRNYHWLNYANVPEEVCRYRRHGSNTTVNIKDSLDSVGTKIRREFLKKALLVDPTMEEIKIHITLSPCKFWKYEDQAWLWKNKDTIIRRGQAWFDKLYRQNLITGFADPSVFLAETTKILDSVKSVIQNDPPEYFLFDLD